jgi:hypothetical protein
MSRGSPNPEKRRNFQAPNTVYLESGTLVSFTGEFLAKTWRKQS